MEDSKLNRRSFLKQTGTALAGRKLIGGGIGALVAGLWPRSAQAKPGGHRAVASHCSAKLALSNVDFPEEITLYLGGGGYASFDNAYDYSNFDSRQVLSASTVSMEWEFDRKFAGNHPQLGLIECDTLVREKSNTRSGILILGDQDGRLFPGTMVNTLFVEMYIPALDLRLFNREPIVLRGITHNMAAEDITADPRAIRNPSGIPSYLSSLVSGSRAAEFDPLGTHSLQEKGVEFYDRRHPEQKVAVLLESTVETFPHYGIDVRMVESRITERLAEVVWEIRNLTYGPDMDSLPPEIVWYVGDSHFFEIVSPKQGVVRLGAEPYRIEVTAVNRHPTKPLISALPDQSLDKGCLFCGAQNAPQTSDFRDFISGFGYTDVFELRAMNGLIPVATGLPTPTTGG